MKKTLALIILLFCILATVFAEPDYAKSWRKKTPGEKASLLEGYRYALMSVLEYVGSLPASPRQAEDKKTDDLSMILADFVDLFFNHDLSYWAEAMDDYYAREENVSQSYYVAIWQILMKGKGAERK